MALWIGNIVFALLAILFTVFAPWGWSGATIYGVVACFLAQNVWYFLWEGRKNILCFEFLFFIAYFFVNFAYPLFYYHQDTFFLFYCIPWEHNVISRATAIAYLGYAFYMLGLLSVRKRNADSSSQESETDTVQPAKEVTYHHFLLLFACMIVFFGLYIITGGWQAMKSVYAGGGSLREVGIYSYFHVLFTIAVYLVCIFIFRLPHSRRWLYLLVVLCVMAIILSTGSRSVALSMALILVVGWNNNVRPFRLWEVLLLLMMGVVGLFFIVSVRQSAGSWIESFRHVRLQHIADMFSDLTVNGRNLYVLVDYGMTHSYTFFHGMLIDLLSPLPGIAQPIVNLMNEPYETLCAQELVSYLAFGSGATWGLGSNMVGDAFRSFGYVGTALSMWLVGWAVCKTREASSHSIYAYVIHYLLISYSVFYTRAPILFPPRLLTWTLLMLWLTYWLCHSRVISDWLHTERKEESCA